MPDRGRPSKFNETIANWVKHLASEGKTMAEAARIIGVAESTIYKWVKEKKDFSESLKEIKFDPDEIVKASLYNRATGYTDHNGKHYPPDPTSCIFWLCNRRPDEWRRNHTPEENDKAEPFKFKSNPKEKE